MKKKQAEKELLESSVTARTQQSQALDHQEKERRRKSILLNKDIIKAARDREIKKQRKLKEEQDSLLSDRRLDYLQIRESKKIEEERRRESLVFRGEEAKKQREIMDLKKINQINQLKDSIAFRKELVTGNDVVKKEEAERRRASLAFRREIWLKHRQFEDEKRRKKVAEEQQELAIKREEWTDVQTFKTMETQAKRASLEKRLEAWRLQRHNCSPGVWGAVDEDDVEKTEREMKVLEALEMANYRKKVEESRKESLLFRASAAKQEREWEQKQREAEKEKERVERKIAEAEREDVKKYQLQLEEARRKSLAFRRQQEVRMRLCTYAIKLMRNLLTLITLHYTHRNHTLRHLARLIYGMYLHSVDGA